jgi:retinol dehydrogenase-12
LFVFFSFKLGVVRTELTRYFGEAVGRVKFTIVMCLIYPLFLWFSKNSEQGAQTTVHCSVSDEAQSISGEYFSDCKVQKLLPHALSDEDGAKLWELSEKMVGLTSCFLT